LNGYDGKTYDGKALVPPPTKEQLQTNADYSSLTFEWYQNGTKLDSESIDAGDYTLKISREIEAFQEYNIHSQIKEFPISIKKRPLTVTAKDQTINFGESILTGTAQVEYDLAQGDTLAAITLSSTQTGAGTYPGGITVEGAQITRDGTDVTANYTITYTHGALTINAAITKVTAWPTASNIQYGQTLINSKLTGGVGTPTGTFTWANPNTIANAVGTAEYAVVFTPTNTNYEAVTGNVSVTVTKATPSVTAPTANTLTYNGTAQALVTAGSTTGGTLQYSLTQDDGYSTTIPTGTDAKTYTVYYKVVGDENYEDLASQSVSVAVGRKAIFAFGTLCF